MKTPDRGTDGRWTLRKRTGSANRLFALFGGIKATATAIDRDIALLSRWDDVPFRYNAAILEAARQRGLRLADVRACLTMVCPTCGQNVRTP